MALYEYRNNAENRIHLSAAARDTVIIGTPKTVEAIVAALKSRPNCAVAFDGYYGVDWPVIQREISTSAHRAGLQIDWIPAANLFSPQEKIAAYTKSFTDIGDPGFGRVNDNGRLEDLIDHDHCAALRARLRSPRTSTIAVFGAGAMFGELIDLFDLKFYFDFTRQPMLWKMWDGTLVPFGKVDPKRDYSWKDYYYNDFYLLHHHKTFALSKMDYYVEAVDASSLKLLPRSTYDAVIEATVRYPIKQVQIFQPGPWGAYRYKDLFDVPGLECNAWNELAGPELSILVDIGCEQMLNLPFHNLMVHDVEMTGPYWSETMPGNFMMDVWLDDGFFPQPTPAERTSMPVHNHPSTEYVRRHFNEPIGRYETYYIAEAYEGATTWMGYLDDCDQNAWELKVRESEVTGKPIPDWKNYIAAHDSAVGDLYLIPPGTTHGHGGNQMVLEMDTSVGLAGTEYSFFAYDFCRKSWDDSTKTMTGRPLKMHTEHHFDAEKWYRKSWVEQHLRARPVIFAWNKEYYWDRYTSLPEMPFEIERCHFGRRGINDTQGRFVQILTPTVGKRVRFQSLSDPNLRTDVNLFQSVVIPAAFGKYEMISLDAGACTVVQIRMKQS
jgi:hypothetical protein